MTVKLVNGKLSNENGLGDVGNVISKIFNRSEDVYRAGDHTVSVARHEGLKYYFIWDHAMRFKFESAILNDDYDSIRAQLQDIREPAFRRQAIYHLGMLERAVSKINSREHQRKLLALATTDGYVELSKVAGGMMVAFSFVRRDLRGNGIAKKLYDAVLVAGGEVLVSGEQQTLAARRLWRSLMKNPEYKCWCRDDYGVWGGVKLAEDQTPNKDENKLLVTPIPIWYPDSVWTPDTTHARLLIKAKKPVCRFINRRKKFN